MGSLSLLVFASYLISSCQSSSPIQNVLQNRWNAAGSLTKLEQSVQDYNAMTIAQAATLGESLRKRRLICLPLDEKFDPPMGNFSHRHVQTGDKMSLPSCFGQAILVNQAAVPFLFAVRRIDGVTGERVQWKEVEEGDSQRVTEYRPLNTKDINVAVGGPLDCRAPSCYVFLPLWMMRLLALKPYDVVEVEQIESVPAGSMAKLRPHSRDFARDISNPQAVLETELRHYSSLTQGSTIAMDYNHKRYWFDVEELRSAPKGEKVPMVKVQDCDLATDFLLSKEELLERKRKRAKAMAEKE